MEKQVKINTLIAKFMGYEIIPYNGNENVHIFNGNKYAKSVGEQKSLWGGLDLQFTGRFTEAVNYPFDTDFNYLLPVIRRIEEQGYVVCIKGINYQIYRVLDEENPIVSLVCGDLSKKTEMTCDLIVNFIENIQERTKKDKKDKILRQVSLQEKIQQAGFNIVTCGHCGSIVYHESADTEIDCPYCDRIMSLSDCPDYLYRGIENNQEFKD